MQTFWAQVNSGKTAACHPMMCHKLLDVQVRVVVACMVSRTWQIAKIETTALLL